VESSTPTQSKPESAPAQFKPESAPAQKPRVIYVMGASRSGTTIFGVTLGNCASIFDAGELMSWLRRSGVPNFEGAERTQFWSGVRDEVAGGADLFGNQAWLCLEHSSSLVRVDRWRSRRRLRPRYRQITEDLYRTVMKASGTRNIVDTSHYPLRVRELQALNGIDLYLIYLVRNPQSVVASFSRRNINQKPMSPFLTNAYLWLTHLLAVLTFLRHPRDRRLFVSYEDFTASPESVLRHIMDRLEIADSLPDFDSLKRGIPFQGNRLLWSDDVLPLRKDSNPEARGLSITRILQFPWVAIHSRLRPSANTHSV
jgi:hypothetical protein